MTKKSYTILAEEKVFYTLEVFAESLEEAVKMVEEGEIDLDVSDSDDFIITESMLTSDYFDDGRDYWG